MIAEIKNLPSHFSSILDLGCGFGANSLFLARQGWRVVAVDISKTAIQKLQEQTKQNNLSYSVTIFSQADAANFSSQEKFGFYLDLDL